MLTHSESLYQEILKCYEYESRNPTIYGNVILVEMEYSKSSRKLRVNK